MAQDSEVVYIDETSFHLWQFQSRCWLRKGMRLTIPDIRGSSITIIGAISEQRGLICYDLVMGTNNTQSFEHFIIKLKGMAQARKTIVVMDNLSVHKAKAVKRHFTFGFQQLFLPTYSCELNPIERLWAVIKNQWRRQQHHFASGPLQNKTQRSNEAA